MRQSLIKRLLSLFLLAGLALPVWHAMAAEPTLPFKSDEADFPVQGQIAIIVLGLVLLLVFCFLGWKRKRGNVQGARWLNWLPAQQSDDGLKVLNSRRLTGNTSLHVVEWEAGKVLLAVGEHGVVKLDEMPSTSSAGKSALPAGDVS